MVQPRAFVALSLVLLAGLAYAADARPIPRITPADAPVWEGQRVRVAGWAVDVRRDPDGGQRLTLRLAGAAIEVRAAIADVTSADWVEATGRLARLSGRLMLLADSMAVTRGPAPLTPTWDELADDPGEWTGEPVHLTGEIEHGILGDGEHALPLRGGPWPQDGPSDLVGVLDYDESCLCHVLRPFDSPWTP